MYFSVCIIKNSHNGGLFMGNALYVDTMIGTVGDGQIEKSHGGGKTYPGACVPGGMVQLSPDTVSGGDNGSGYNYCHNTIEGFSFNRMSGIGWYGDLGNLQVMPVTEDTDLRSGSNEELPFNKGTIGWKSEFSHENEKSRAGYYSVMLDRYNVLAECTASEHAGCLKFTYPADSEKKIIINFSRRIGGKADYQKVDIINSRRIEGYIKCTPAGGGFGHGHGKIFYDVYFVMEFSQPFTNKRFFESEEFTDATEGEDLGVFLDFSKENTELLTVKCAISYVDIEGARKNFSAECENSDFDAMAENALAKWEDVFSCINVSGTDETDLKLFYTCLYHVLLDPRTMADTDGRYKINYQIFENTDYKQRTVFSGWDVYRSEFPLLSIIRPDMVRDEINSLLKIAELNNSSFPRWELMGINAGCMVGDPGLIVLADAVIKGILPYDTEKAYEISKASSICLKELDGKEFRSIRPDCKAYLDGCYVPEKLSDTLEYLLADFTMAKFAEYSGKTEDAKFFAKRANRYGENYNEALQFLAPRKENGEFVFEEDRYDDDGTVESNIFQQSWFVPYDVKGLSRLFGEERTIELLEEFFERADLKSLWNDDYNHSNEPCHNITHYFGILGLPERTQYWTRRVQKEAYRTGAYGFCGNEDVGQLSAWYVLSALGFAQVCPADPKYYLNTPLFKDAEIRLDKKFHSCKVSDKLSIKCDKNPLDFPYIKSVRLNGAAVDKIYLTYEEITNGGEIVFELKK
ncbi:MAG: GH92 family glycosyl hydrolase [Clostridia bacterium]|nr:GH92 family glycosyl hydrolase [Clostridia bacterium]